MTKSTAPQPFVFVLMPFSKEFDDTYALGIKPACERAGAYVERVDEQIFAGSILDRIYNQISKADLIVSDLTGRNPNVFYETGYAHAIGKTTILLTQSADDIPFDLMHYHHITYEGRITHLSAELEKRIRWHLQFPGEKAQNSRNLMVRVNGLALGGGVVEIQYDTDFPGSFGMRVDLHNMIDRVINTVQCQIGIFTDQVFRYISIGNKHVNSIPQDSGEYLHLSRDYFSILPGAWESFYISFLLGETEPPPGSYDFTLRAFFESGIEDYKFRLVVPDKYT